MMTSKNDKIAILLTIAACLLGYCWNAQGMLDEVLKPSDYNAPITAGDDHAVGLRPDGTVVAVGHNTYGQCNVKSWRDIVAIAAGNRHTVGLMSNGTVVANGDNKYGQTNVIGVTDWQNIVAIAASSYHTVGLRSDGTVVAVGDDYYGQLNVSGWRNIVAITAGNSHTVGLKPDGTVVAVGNNGFGQLNVTGWRDIVAIAAANRHTVGLKSDGTVVAVGENDDGRLNVTGWRGIVAIATSSYHTVGLKSDGTVVAVGWWFGGRLAVTNWRYIEAIAASDCGTFGLKSDGTVVAVGAEESVVRDFSGLSGIGKPIRYVVSGTVIDNTGKTISDVNIQSRSKYSYTDLLGRYNIADQIGINTLTPLKDGYTFSPSYRIVTEDSPIADFIGTYTISGSVKDAYGKGMQGVSFVVDGKTYTTNYNGNFTISGLSGDIKLVPSPIYGYNFSPTQLTASGPSSTLNFTAEYRISGKMTDYNGNGLEGFLVTAGSKTALTDKDGSYSLTGLSGSQNITPAKEGYSFSPAYKTLTGPETSVNFKAGYTISGSVKDAYGKGIQGVSFIVDGKTYNTSISGDFFIEGISGNMVLIPNSMVGYSFKPEQVSITRSASNINFTAEYRISGKVTDYNGNGLEGFLVTAGSKTALTDKDGSYSLTGLSGSQNITPAKEGYGFSPAYKTLTGPETSVNFKAGYTISGSVKDAYGKGMQGVSFVINNKTYSTNSSGNFVIDGLIGDVKLVPNPIEGYSFSPAQHSASGPTSSLNFIAEYRISGKVTDYNGNGLEGFLVTAGGKTTLTDKDGAYSFTGLSGSMNVTPSKEGYSFSPTYKAVTGPGTNVSFKVSYGVSGKVTDSDGIGIEAVTLSIGDKSASTAKDGFFKADGLGGKVKVTASKEGYTFTPAEMIASGPTSNLYFIALYEIRGYIRDEDGNGLEGIEVIAGEKKVMTDTKGLFVLLGLSGKEELSFKKEGYTFEPSTKTISGPIASIVIIGMALPPPVIYSYASNYNIERVTTDGAPKASPRVSPNMQMLAYASAEVSKQGELLWSIYALRFGQQGILTVSGVKNTNQPTWLPTSEKIVYVHYGLADKPLLVTQSYKGGSLSFISLTPIGDYTQYPDIASKGDSVVFQTRMQGKDYVFTMSMDGSDQRLITEGIQPQWGPVGTSILFSRRVGTYYQITMLNENNEISQLTQGEYDNLFPCWSPDGEWVSFISKMDGRWHLYIMRSDGTNLTQLTKGDSEAFYCDWGSDGWLYFVSDAGSPSVKTRDPWSWRYSDIWRLQPVLPK